MRHGLGYRLWVEARSMAWGWQDVGRGGRVGLVVGVV